MDNQTMELIVKTLAMALCCIITFIYRKYIKTRISADNLEELRNLAEIAVRSAEQIYNSEDYNTKKKYVIDYITDKVVQYGVDMSAEDIEALVESTVNFVKYSVEYRR